MTALSCELAELIAAEGPVTVERYMALCLGHPRHGYYGRRDPLGAAGDFVTAPEISQMFGELIGIWAIEAWTAMGAPDRFRLVELGPGRGTLMADLLRAARIAPAFMKAVSVDLVETSPALATAQRRRLGAGTAAPIAWRQSFAEVPPGPCLVVANEFFDALPIRQFIGCAEGWHERLVGLRPDGSLAFGLAATAEPAMRLPPRCGEVLEWPAAALALFRDILRRLRAEGGAALVVDYGEAGPPLGDTLQAVARHRYADPLAAPGEADLTAHVRFDLLRRLALEEGAAAYGPVGQGAFLRALGIELRAAALRRRATPQQAEAIAAALARLTGAGPGAMGRLFKAFAVADPRILHLAGFGPAGPGCGAAAPCPAEDLAC